MLNPLRRGQVTQAPAGGLRVGSSLVERCIGKGEIEVGLYPRGQVLGG